MIFQQCFLTLGGPLSQPDVFKNPKVNPASNSGDTTVFSVSEGGHTVAHEVPREDVFDVILSAVTAG